MHILAIEPFYGGSHQAFIDGWIAASRHQFTLLSLPDSHWKWRMRQAAIHFAREIAARYEQGERWDAVWASDMLNLAELRGLLPATVAELPTVLYFHENQLTYPVRDPRERDLHFGFTNFISCCAAEAVWFNSRFHRDSFLEAAETMLRAMPDRQPLAELRRLRAICSVQSPGVEIASRADVSRDGPLRIVWAARWEHDKNPGDFFAALAQLKQRGVDFRLAVIGERYRECPVEFDQIRERFADHIDHWGYQPTREDYVKVLHWADCFVSTADHEFFGISAAEAMAAGCWPILPWRLAYPELLGEKSTNREIPPSSAYFYDGSVTGLVDKLTSLAATVDDHNAWDASTAAARTAVERFRWSVRAREMDDAIARIANRGISSTSQTD